MAEPELNPDLARSIFFHLYNTAVLLYDNDGLVPRACEAFTQGEKCC